MATKAFIYKWTHIPTQKWYIGSRTKNGCNPNDGYICSSKLIKPMIVENQSEWVRTILCIGNSKDMLDLESRYLTALDAKNDPMSYNQHNGDGKFSTTGIPPWNKGKPGKKGRIAWNKGLSKATNPSLAKMAKTKLGKEPSNKGVPMSEEQKKKISESSIGKISPKKGLPGPKQTAESNAKRSATQTGRKQSPEHIAKKAAARRAFYANKKAA